LKHAGFFVPALFDKWLLQIKNPPKCLSQNGFVLDDGFK